MPVLVSEKNGPHKPECLGRLRAAPQGNACSRLTSQGRGGREVRQPEGGALERAKKADSEGGTGTPQNRLGPTTGGGLVLSPSRFPPRKQFERG